MPQVPDAIEEPTDSADDGVLRQRLVTKSIQIQTTRTADLIYEREEPLHCKVNDRFILTLCLLCLRRLESQMQKSIGWLLVICSGLTIVYNVAQVHFNKQQVEEHPFATVLTGGENLKPAYTFLPPYTGFEVVVITVLIVGGIIIYNAKNKSSGHVSTESHGTAEYLASSMCQARSNWKS
jgi:hypothetical protein